MFSMLLCFTSQSLCPSAVSDSGNPQIVKTIRGGRGVWKRGSRDGSLFPTNLLAALRCLSGSDQTTATCHTLTPSERALGFLGMGSNNWAAEAGTAALLAGVAGPPGERLAPATDCRRILDALRKLFADAEEVSIWSAAASNIGLSSIGSFLTPSNTCCTCQGCVFFETWMSSYGRNDAEMVESLGWLWGTCVTEVLDGEWLLLVCGLGQSGSTPLPRFAKGKRQQNKKNDDSNFFTDINYHRPTNTYSVTRGVVDTAGTRSLPKTHSGTCLALTWW